MNESDDQISSLLPSPTGHRSARLGVELNGNEFDIPESSGPASKTRSGPSRLFPGRCFLTCSSALPPDSS